MHRLLFAALLGAAVYGCSSNRIIGGEECTPNSKPWQVSVQYFDQHVCGGILINKDWVLTAAHCQLPSLQVRLGEHHLVMFEGREQFNFADKICPHKDFNTYTYENDIMLLKLGSPAALNKYVQAIPLASSNLPENIHCLASGWGALSSPTATYPDTLQCVHISSYSTVACQQAYPEDVISDNMLCAGIEEGGKDTCQGDSGGPLVCNEELHGITSWGNVPCAVAGKPGIYTRVYTYLKWIQDTISAGDCI